MRSATVIWLKASSVVVTVLGLGSSLLIVCAAPPETTSGKDDPQAKQRANMDSACTSTECLKQQETMKTQLELAYQITIARIAADKQAADTFGEVVAAIDKGVAPTVGGDALHHKFYDNGTEELLLATGTKTDVHLIFGERNPKTGDVDTILHVAADASGQRVVQSKDGIVLEARAIGPQLTIKNGRPTPGRNARAHSHSEGEGEVAGATAVPDVACFGFSRDGAVRIVCLCYTNTSNGFQANVCYDSGWIAA